MSQILSDRRLVRAGLVTAVVIVGAAFFLRPAASGAGTVRRASTGSSTETALSAPVEDFTVSTLSWQSGLSATDEPLLNVSPDQDSRLLACGSDAWENSVLALADNGRAYCIQPVDKSDPESVSQSRILAMKLISGGTYTDAELNVLRLQTLLGYAQPESPQASSYRDQLNEAWGRLSSAEQAHLSE